MSSFQYPNICHSEKIKSGGGKKQTIEVATLATSLPRTCHKNIGKIKIKF